MQTLTPREQQIADLTARGLQAGEIAKQLGISPSTVKNHRSKIYVKLGARNAIEMTLIMGGVVKP